MASSEFERLSRLRSDLNRSLDSLARRTMFPTPTFDSRGRAARATAGAAADVSAPGNWRSQPASSTVSVNVVLKGGVIFMDDERHLRALAKEIKRLISEDDRRGLGVGS